MGSCWCGGDGVAVADIPRGQAVEGDKFGAVTDAAARVEDQRARGPALVAKLIDLPPRFQAAFDAYVFEPRPTGGPANVVAIGAGGQVLGSNLPTLEHSRWVGTVHAFGTTWLVELSTSPDGYWVGTCVTPQAARPSLLQVPCRRAPGGRPNVQSSDGRHPSALVTTKVDDSVQAVDVIANVGTVFHAVMLPIRNHGTDAGNVAVIALEGGGQGRLVYHLGGGRTDGGRTRSADVTWPNLGQVIGPGSFPPPVGT
jgi:hypothetical protein